MKKRAIEPVKGIQPGFNNLLFLVKKVSGAWRLELEASSLNQFVKQTNFSMETTESVLSSISRSDWMISINMKNRYFHVSIHSDSRKYLMFAFNGVTYQFRALCFIMRKTSWVTTRELASLSETCSALGSDAGFGNKLQEVSLDPPQQASYSRMMINSKIFGFPILRNK